MSTQRKTTALAAKKARPAKSTADGRIKRGERNKEAIVGALYDLIREGQVQPAIEAVAAKAGVGTRTVFRQFAHIDDLYRGLAHRLRGEVMRLVDFAPPSGRLETDVRALVARRARVFEYIMPFRHAGRLVSHQSAFLREEQLAGAKLFRAAIEANLGQHLDALSEPRRADILEALDVLLSFEAWDRLRDQQGLSSKRACEVVVNAALLLVTTNQKKYGV